MPIASRPPRRPLTRFFAQAAFATAFTYLTSGVFLSGLALLMGAGDVLVGYLSVIVNICGVLVLLFSALLEQFPSRKRLAVGLTVLSRLATLSLVAIPALVPAGLRLALFVPMVVLAFTLQAQTTVVLNQWMLGFLAERRQGRDISLRQTLTLLVTVALSLLGGVWMDGMGGCKFRVMASLPLKDRPFRGFALYILCFYLLLTLSDSFTMVYLMKYLALPYRSVTALSLILSLPQLVLLGAWGRISDQRGHSFALHASIWLFAGQTLFMSFAGPQSWYIFIPLAFLMGSVANAGFAVAVFNRRYELMPPDRRIVYDNFYTAAIGLGSILGPMLGGLLKSCMESCPSVMGALPFASIRLLFPLSTAGILLLQFLSLCARRKRTSPLPCPDAQKRAA